MPTETITTPMDALQALCKLSTRYGIYASWACNDNRSELEAAVFALFGVDVWGCDRVWYMTDSESEYNAKVSALRKRNTDIWWSSCGPDGCGLDEK